MTMTEQQYHFLAPGPYTFSGYPSGTDYFDQNLSFCDVSPIPQVYSEPQITNDYTHLLPPSLPLMHEGSLLKRDPYSMDENFLSPFGMSYATLVGAEAMSQQANYELSSRSYLTITNDYAIFHGTLDIETLGGAGFASQRTTGDDRHWDLSHSAGLELLVNLFESDEKSYTLILKDTLLPPSDGREQSTTSWEYDFSKEDAHVSSDDAKLGSFYVSWDMLKPTYRGRPCDDASALRKDDIRRFSIMSRSFFGTQAGDFRLAIVAINQVAQ
ncbi:hypothetical protein LTR64_006073 [Lithohypha guttulata]|uniref:uncharacterized protein n=1 Tax=Lithohypha guttulata TaxID=1690604 RepID=UPI00315C973A